MRESRPPSTVHSPQSRKKRHAPFLLWTVDRGLWTVVICWIGLSPTAQAHSGKAAVAVKTYTSITVDGKLDDWVRRLRRSDWTAQLEVKKDNVLEFIRAVPIPLNILTGRVEAGRVDDPQDFSAIVYTLWDEQYLYFAAVVSDDHVVVQHDGKEIWQDDTMEVWCDCRHDAVTHTLFQDDEYQLGFSPAGTGRAQAAAWVWRNPRTEPVIAAMQVASSLQPDGYILEAAVPWAALQGCRPTIGGMMGFNLSMVDKDADELWTHVTWSGQLHSDPSQFGHLYFVDAPIDLFPEDIIEQPVEDAPWERQNSP